MSDTAVPAAIVANLEAPVETSVDTKVTDQKHPDNFASKFAALTRKERELKEREKNREAEWNSKLAEVTEKQKKYSSYESLDAELSSDKRKALEFLQSKGVTLEDLNELLVDELNPNEEVKMKRMQSESERRMEAKIAALEKAFEDKESNKKQSEEQAAKEQHEKVVQKVMGDLTEFVNSDENYELIRTYQSVDMVYEVMNQHYLKQVNDGVPEQMIKILTYKEACDAVESHLEEDVTKKYEAKRAKQAPKTNEQESRKTSQTLSNTLASEVPVSGERQLSNEESLRRAAAMLRYHND